MDTRVVNQYMALTGLREKVFQEYADNWARQVYVDEATGRSLSDLFLENLNRWRPWDSRMYLQFQQEEFNNIPSETSVTVHKHLKLGALGVEDRATYSLVEMGVYLNGNMSAFVDYNKKVEASHHVKPTSFDPETGKLVSNRRTKRGGHAKSLQAPSPHVMKLDDIYNTDELKLLKPKVDWVLVAVWKMKIQAMPEGFFQVESEVLRGDKVLLRAKQDEVSLSRLCGEVMHVVFGSTTKKSEADFSDGVRQLLSGEKAMSGFDRLRASLSPFHHLGWRRLSDNLLSMSKMLIALGAAVLAYLAYDKGWNIDVHKSLVVLAIMFLGVAGSALLDPISKVVITKKEIKSLRS